VATSLRRPPSGVLPRAATLGWPLRHLLQLAPAMTRRRGGSVPTLPLPPPAPPAPRPLATPAPPEYCIGWGLLGASLATPPSSRRRFGWPTATRSQASRATAGGTAAAALSSGGRPSGTGGNTSHPVQFQDPGGSSGASRAALRASPRLTLRPSRSRSKFACGSVRHVLLIALSSTRIPACDREAHKEGDFPIHVCRPKKAMVFESPSSRRNHDIDNRPRHKALRQRKAHCKH
jgi:hypothetical protein